MKRPEIEKKLKKELDKERFTHTIGVMYTAASLAMAHQADMEKAIYAGLLHDCAKCIPNSDKIKMCRKNGISITKAEEENPYLIHAKLGAYLAEKEYKVKDEEILHAIRVHTTGEPYMNDLDKIIYIADYIEPNRNKAPDLNEVRGLAFEDLDLAMVKILSDTLDYLGKKDAHMDPMTRDTYQFFRELIASREA